MKNHNTMNNLKLDEIISEYYDRQMNDSKLISFESRMALSSGIREYTGNQCFKFFKISNSIKLVKYRNKTKSKILFYDLLNRSLNLTFNVYTVRFKSFYKCFCDRFLNVLRNNS